MILCLVSINWYNKCKKKYYKTKCDLTARGKKLALVYLQKNKQRKKNCCEPERLTGFEGNLEPIDGTRHVHGTADLLVSGLIGLGKETARSLQNF